MTGRYDAFPRSLGWKADTMHSSVEVQPIQHIQNLTINIS